MKIAVELDMAYEDTLEDAIESVRSHTGCDVFVTNDSGPAGGWPEVLVVGTLSQVIMALTDAPGWNMDAEDALEILKAG